MIALPGHNCVCLQVLQISSVLKYALALIFLLSGLLAIYLANQYGVGITGDSLYYLRISRDFQLNGLLTILDSPAAGPKPPLYPIVLSLFNDNALVLNLLGFTVTYLLSAWWAGCWLKNAFYYIVFCGLMGLGTPVILVHVFVWTEPLFMPLMLLFYFLLYKALIEKKWYWFLLAGVLASTMCAIRYAGILVFASVIVGMLVGGKVSRKYMLLIGLLGILFFLIWFGLAPENLIWRVKLALTPYTEGRVYWYGRNVVAFLEGFGLWFLPLNLPFILRIVFSLAWLALTGYAVKKLSKVGKEGVLRILLISFLSYYLMLHLVYLIEYYTVERYLLPFYPAVILGILYFVQEQRLGVSLKYIALAACLIVVGYNSVRTAKNVKMWHEVRKANKADTIENLPEDYYKVFDEAAK